MATDRPKIQTRVAPDIYRDFDKLAEAFELSVYELASLVIADYVEKKREEAGKIAQNRKNNK